MTEEGEFLEEDLNGGLTERSRGRLCTFHYRAGDDGNISSRRRTQPAALQQPSQHRPAPESANRMPSNRDMPSYEEWKRRRANRPIGEEVVLLELDPKEELARRRVRDQRLMSLLKPEEQSNFYTYLDHYERVQAKVQQDRETRERQKAEAAKQAVADAERQKQDQHRVRKRLEKVALTTDSQFTADVAKSKYYRLVQQEQKQDFKSRYERDQFWESSLQSKGLLRQQRSGLTPSGGDSAADQAPEEEDSAARQQLIWEKTDDNIQLGGAGVSSATPGRGLAQGSSMSRAQHNRFLEELFPRAEQPKLASFDVDFSKKEEKTPEELELERLQEKRRLRLEEWREHRHMQQMAVTFGVTTRRILDERPVRESADRLMDDADSDLGQVFGEALERARRRQLEGTRGGSSANREFDLTDPRLLQPWRRPARRQKRPVSTFSSTTMGNGAADRPLTTPATNASGATYAEEADAFEAENRRQPLPAALLSMAQAHDELPKVEAKGSSTLWNNYMSAGNVRFAPLDDDNWYRAKTSTTATATG